MARRKRDTAPEPETTGHEWDGIQRAEQAAAQMVAVCVLRHHRMGDRLLAAFHHIAFGVEGGGAFEIATTRPELLPACVGVTAHPYDARYQPLFGKRAVTPHLPRAGADLPERARRPREGHRHPHGLHLRRRDRRAVVARAALARSGRSSAATAVSSGRRSAARAWRASTPTAANARYAGIARQGRRRGAPGDRRAAARSGERRRRRRGAAPRRAEADRALGQVLREGRPAARVHLDPAVVRAFARQEGRAARQGRRDPLAPGLHAAPLPQLDGEPRTSTGASAASATSACRFPVWYPLDADGQPDHAHPIVAAPRHAAGRSDGRRAARLSRRAARPARRLHRRDRRLRHLVHQLADAADRARGWLLDPERHAAAVPGGHPARRATRSSAPGPSTPSPRRCCTRTRSRGTTWSSPAGSSIPTARRCRRARATS